MKMETVGLAAVVITNDSCELDCCDFPTRAGYPPLERTRRILKPCFPPLSSILTFKLQSLNSKEIYDRFHASYTGKEDIHTRLMRKYEDIPSWWFYVLLGVTVAASLVPCIFLNNQVQMPWWGLIFACIITFIFTLPISIITTTTNQVPEQKKWWQRYNYILSAALDAGVAFMAVLLYLSIGMKNKRITWWGTKGEHCGLVTCPTAKGIVADGCPVN
ncbi:Oligopeptide transporter 4 [Camellia lanceoleosa]|uniref:Oligopeptide transporter 4 n=1 Tax=Camellia lanceoleosa TaxID=1840588 RepID=A0ACC0FSL4_9ERIC|nr:Oligopeptide transporter 4 [Camellia lanceoleosa]